jgi:hypothetical protein
MQKYVSIIEKKLCPYKDKCYRKNPVHFNEMSHPHRKFNFYYFKKLLSKLSSSFNRDYIYIFK